MRWRPRRRLFGPAQRAGFTLIELMLVLATAGTMLVLAVPRFGPTRYRADDAAQLVRLTLKVAQRTALTRQHDVLVSFDTVNQRIRVVWDANSDGVIAATERATWTPLHEGSHFVTPVWGITGSATAPVTGSGVRVLDAMPTIAFHRDGSVTTDAEIYVATEAPTVDSFRAIRLTRATGRTTCFRQSASGTWSAAKL